MGGACFFLSPLSGCVCMELPPVYSRLICPPNMVIIRMTAKPLSIPRFWIRKKTILEEVWACSWAMLSISGNWGGKQLCLMWNRGNASTPLVFVSHNGRN